MVSPVSDDSVVYNPQPVPTSSGGRPFASKLQEAQHAPYSSALKSAAQNDVYDSVYDYLDDQSNADLLATWNASQVNTKTMYGHALQDILVKRGLISSSEPPGPHI